MKMVLRLIFNRSVLTAVLLAASSLVVWFVGPTVQVGVSVGTAVTDGGEGDSAGLLAVADRAMYQVKHAGR